MLDAAHLLNCELAGCRLVLHALAQGKANIFMCNSKDKIVFSGWEEDGNIFAWRRTWGSKGQHKDLLERRKEKERRMENKERRDKN